MNKIHHKFVLLVFAFCMLGCNDDFLERYPTASLSPQTFFQSENDFIAYTNLFYSYFPGGSGIYGETADNIVKSSIDREVSGTRLVPTTDSKWDWRPLRHINFMLNSENVKNYSNAVVRDKYVGLARFFRAYFYFEKVRWYGDVPWYNEVITTDDDANLFKPRDPRTLVMDSVLADINFAIEHLSTEPDVERVTKWTALALKSRICLYEGTWRKYHTEFGLPGAEEFLQECVKASETLMNEGPYQVHTGDELTPGRPYQDLFAHLTLDPVADEVILGRRYSSELELKHGLQFYITARTQGKPGLEKKLINSYLMADGSRFTDIPDYDKLEFFDEVQNRDPRLAQTIRTPGYTRIGEATPIAPDFESTTTGYQPIKWMNSPEYDGNNQSIQDLLLFRFGEVLLNYAEAKAELGTLTQADIDISIKLLRDRVGMPNLDMAAANATPDPYLLSQYVNVSGANTGVILEIRRERRIELVMENELRWEDLMRWKEGHLLAETFEGMYFPGPGFYDLDQNGSNDVEVYSGSKPPATGPYQIPTSALSEGTSGNIVPNKGIVKTFDETKDYLWPLPKEDLTLNPQLTQNPHWK